MPDRRADLEGVSVVLVGNFNPKIFQPSWFDHHDLLRKEEVESAENLVSVPDVTTFVAGWLSLQATKERFAVSTADAAHFEALRDLVLGTFSLLEHTPINQMGINRDSHFRLEEGRYVSFGHFLVPKTPWKPVLADPRTITLTVESFEKRGSETPRLRVKVEPSVRIPLAVYFETNEHYEIAGEDAGKRLMGILKTNWVEAHSASQRIVQHLLGQEY
jgi:hypothetical protein